MKIEIELDREILRGYRVNMQEREMEGAPVIPLAQWAVECIRPMAQCITDDNIVDGDDRIVVTKEELSEAARGVAKEGGDYHETYLAMIEAAKSYARGRTQSKEQPA